MTRVVIEIRETGHETYTAVACEGRYATTGKDQSEMLITLCQQLPTEMLQEEPEVRVIPLPTPSNVTFFEGTPWSQSKEGRLYP